MERIKQLITDQKKVNEANRLRKSESWCNDEWYSGRCLWGHNWARWFILLGSREKGKSYDVMKFYLRQWKKSKGKRVFYWIRLTDTEQAALLKNNALKLIDPDLRRNHLKGYDIVTNGPEVYVCKRDINGKMIRGSKKLLCHVLALSTAGNSKGQGYFDKDYLNDPEAYYNICLDEMNRAETAKNTFNIVSALKVQLENLIRSTENRVRIVCIGNLTGVSDILASWNFIPHEFGIFKLRSKGVLIHNIPNGKAYVARRSKSALNKAFPMEEDSNYTNNILYDKKLIIPAKTRLVHADNIIKFSKNPNDWYVIWDGNIIKKYNNNNCTRVTAMVKYIDEVYNLDLVNNIIDRFNNRSFRYKDLTTFIKFQSHIQLLKR